MYDFIFFLININIYMMTISSHMMNIEMILEKNRSVVKSPNCLI
jgi:hypothetical protein